MNIMRTFEIESLEQLLLVQAPHFPFDKTFSKAVDDPILLVHSSGTTGNPKIVTMTHGTVSVTDNDRLVACPEGRKPQNGAQFNFEDGGGFYSCFPPYHLAGVQAFLILPILSSTASIIAGPTSLPPSGNLISSIVERQHGFIRALYVPPSLIEQWALLPEAMNQAERLDFILYGGGPLPTAVGNRLSQVTDVCQMYGSAETGQIQLLVPRKDKGDWAYMEWNPAEEIDMQPSLEGTYELVLHQEPKHRQHRSLSHNFPQTETWQSGDLFVQHPTKPALWRYYGRIDDLIVLANSHKIHPVAFETNIQSHPQVAGVIMFGTARVQPGLLVELRPATCLTEELKESIWEQVNLQNTLVPRYGRISKSKVLFSVPAKPFIRAPKGSVVRKATLELYTQDIEKLYINAPEFPKLDWTSEASSIAWIRALLQDILLSAQVEEDDDLFENGLDSIGVAELVNAIKSALNQASYGGEEISFPFVYRNPTIKQLASATRQAVTSPCNRLRSIQDRSQAQGFGLDGLVDFYSKFSSPLARECVVLTGATGFLGSQVLRSLLQEPCVDTIFLLTRPFSLNEAKAKIHDILQCSKIESAAPRVEFIEADLSRDDLGINLALYKNISSKVTSIVHTAWKVDFNLSLQSFQKFHLNGLRSIVNLSISSPRKPHIVYTSSTAYSLDWAMAQNVDIIPEEILPNLEETSASAYGVSKQLGERILEIASINYHVPVTVLRIGQIVGSKSDSLMLRTHFDWIQALITTSKSLDLIPSSQMSIDWMPVDVVASMVTNAVRAQNSANLSVQNVVHPAPVPWARFVEALQAELPSAKVVSFAEWMDAVEQRDGRSLEILDKIPALKLKGFFKDLCKLANKASSGRQETVFETSKAYSCTDATQAIQSLDMTLLVRQYCLV